MRTKEELIILIAKHLLATGYIRADNFKSYSLKELIKTCGIYKISI